MCVVIDSTCYTISTEDWHLVRGEGDSLVLPERESDRPLERAS